MPAMVLVQCCECVRDNFIGAVEPALVDLGSYDLLLFCRQSDRHHRQLPVVQQPTS
jgi:hypothetical protein